MNKRYMVGLELIEAEWIEVEADSPENAGQEALEMMDDHRDWEIVDIECLDDEGEDEDTPLFDALSDDDEVLEHGRDNHE